MYLADLHIHSRFSRATSREGDLPHLDFWARRKGLALLGTGDFTHPAWRRELHEQLIPSGQGVYALRQELLLDGLCPGPAPQFVITGEISSIYKRDGKTRKVHNLILLPSLEAADELSARLEAIGNIHSDGRPILGLDSRDLLELTLECCPEAELIPAHIWTPHFAMFGAFSGFDSIGACFADLTPHIHAVETGLSSDPPMNWRISSLDHLTLVSNSDAHSPSKLGREANLLDTGISYPELIASIRTGQGFLGTVEFFPEEGKYHLDGHRSCGVCLTPSETLEHGGLCPICGKKLTIGVEHRVQALADRPMGFRPEGAKPFESLAPLPEVIAASTGLPASGKKVQEIYEHLLCTLGAEFPILRQLPLEDIAQAAGPCVAEGIRRLRLGQVDRQAGFDGEYGKITLLTPSEIQQFSGQISLFGAEGPAKRPKASRSLKKTAVQPEELFPTQSEQLNPAQLRAVTAKSGTVAVVAGPGAGKTKTLVSRIAYLIQELGVKPSEITAVTFTNQAAAELRRRLEAQLGGKRAVSRMTIGTFHAVCLTLLKDVQIVSQAEAHQLARQMLKQAGSRRSPQSFLQAVSRIKNGTSCEDAGLDPALFEAYCQQLTQAQLLDFDDVLIEACKLDVTGRKAFSHLLVDEFQDISAVQYSLIRAWNGGSLFVIGDPDQSIYGFRGASGRFFDRLFEDFEDVQAIYLTENYRSTPEILDAALSVIAHNPGPARTLTAHLSRGPAVRLVQAADDFSEAVWIAKEISRMTGGVDMLQAQALGHDRTARAFSEIAVLCRTHRQLQLIENCLQHDDIPCVVSGHAEFLQSDEVRGVLSFFDFLLHPQNTAALRTALALLWDCPADLLETAPVQLQQADSPLLEAFAQQAQQWSQRAASEKPWKLLEQWQAQYGASDNLQKLQNTAVFYASLPDLLNALTLGQEADVCRAAGNNWRSGAVSLMTLHGSKGLEFPAVFVAGLRSGILPMQAADRSSDLEEERRLFYVGMTRAQQELILTTGPDPSSFVAELPASVLKEQANRPTSRPLDQISLF